MTMIARRTFVFGGRSVAAGDRLQLSPLDAVIQVRAGNVRYIRPGEGATLQRRDLEAEPATDSLPADAPPARRTRRRDLKA